MAIYADPIRKLAKESLFIETIKNCVTRALLALERQKKKRQFRDDPLVGVLGVCRCVSVLPHVLLTAHFSELSVYVGCEFSLRVLSVAYKK